MLEDLQFTLFGDLGLDERLTPLHQPKLLLLVDDMHVFETNLTTVEDS
jgi:hypothetical protein